MRFSFHSDRRRNDSIDWLIAFLLLLATIQTARADFFVNDTFLDWHQYALGRAPLPYQGRAALVPILRWAANNQIFRRVTARYAITVQVGTLYYEPVTPEKFMSLLLGLVSLGFMMLVAFWWARRRRVSPWWLSNVLVLLIVGVTVALRSTTNYWYAYDLPHAALFGAATVFALENCWVAAICCFASDVPLRETSLFLVEICGSLFLAQSVERMDRRVRLQGVESGRPDHPCSGFNLFNRVSLMSYRGAIVGAAGLVLGMSLFWAIVRNLIRLAYKNNVNQTYPRLSQNIHELLYPHHWPQLLSAGGYLPLLVWIYRRDLSREERILLYGCAVCIPITLWFGVWTETRVWLEWTLPLAALATSEVVHRMRPAFLNLESNTK